MLIYPSAGQSRFCTKLTLLRNIELDLLFQLSQDWKFLKGSVSEMFSRLETTHKHACYLGAQPWVVPSHRALRQFLTAPAISAHLTPHPGLENIPLIPALPRLLSAS